MDDTSEGNQLNNDDKVATSNIREVMEGDAECWVSCEDNIGSIGFVVHINDIKGGKYRFLHGISNLFFVHFTSISSSHIPLFIFSQFVDC